MSEQHSIAEALSNLEDLVDKAESGEAVELTREGEPVAVLIGVREYERLNGASPVRSAYMEWRRTADFDSIGDPDDVWGNVRARGPGRDPQL